jgi:curved DNA-binding protein CbpA
MSYEEPDFKEQMLREQRLCKRARRVLGVTEDAGPVEIKRAYWRFALAYHPDRNPRDARRAEKFALIAEAYDILVNHTNPARRHALNKRDDYVAPPLDEQEYCRWWVKQFRDLF